MTTPFYVTKPKSKSQSAYETEVKEMLKEAEMKQETKKKNQKKRNNYLSTLKNFYFKICQ